MLELKYSLFNGEKVWEGTSVAIEDGRIASVTDCASEGCGEGFVEKAARLGR